MTAVHQERYHPVRQELMPSLTPSSLKYDQAVSMVKDIVWEKLEDHTIGEALEMWLATLGRLTATNYRSGMRKLIEGKHLNLESSLQSFALVNHESIIDRIKTTEGWSECTKQSRAACYISFTGFLSRRFQGLIKKAVPSKEGASKTFYRVHDKVKSNAMTQAQWVEFLGAITNERDRLIAKVALQGGKRINEVLTLSIAQINWERCEITFIQSKTKGTHKETVITYPKHLIESLKTYIGERQGLVFITRNNKSVPLIQLANSFERAGIKASVPFKVTPHVLRASTVTFLKQQGFSDSDVMKVTGHASSEMVFAYDKSSRADNASKRVCLV